MRNFQSILFFLVICLSHSCKKDELSRVNPHDIDGSAFSLPVVKNGSLSSEATNVFYSGEVLSEGGLPVDERGVCYNFSGNHSIAFYRSKSGSGPGVYHCEINNLLMGYTYYFRAYAISKAGVAYGAELSITIN